MVIWVIARPTRQYTHIVMLLYSDNNSTLKNKSSTFLFEYSFSLGSRSYTFKNIIIYRTISVAHYFLLFFFFFIYNIANNHPVGRVPSTPLLFTRQRVPAGATCLYVITLQSGRRNLCFFFFFVLSVKVFVRAVSASETIKIIIILYAFVNWRFKCACARDILIGCGVRMDVFLYNAVKKKKICIKKLLLSFPRRVTLYHWYDTHECKWPVLKYIYMLIYIYIYYYGSMKY